MRFRALLRMVVVLLTAGHLAMLPVMAAVHIASHDVWTKARIAEFDESHQAETGPPVRENHLHQDFALGAELACEVCQLYSQFQGKKGTVSAAFSWPLVPAKSSPWAEPGALPGLEDSAPPKNKSPPIA